VETKLVGTTFFCRRKLILFYQFLSTNQSERDAHLERHGERDRFIEEGSQQGLEGNMEAPHSKCREDVFLACLPGYFTHP
jgi:hypothetical protein